VRIGAISLSRRQVLVFAFLAFVFAAMSFLRYQREQSTRLYLEDLAQTLRREWSVGSPPPRAAGTDDYFGLRDISGDLLQRPRTIRDPRTCQVSFVDSLWIW